MPFIELFNIFNRNNPGANYVTDISALPTPVNNLTNATAFCLNPPLHANATNHQPQPIESTSRRPGRFLRPRHHGRNPVRSPNRRALYVLASATHRELASKSHLRVRREPPAAQQAARPRNPQKIVSRCKLLVRFAADDTEKLSAAPVRQLLPRSMHPTWGT